MSAEHFSLSQSVPTTFEHTRQMIVTSFAAALAKDGFRIESQSESMIVLTHTYREFPTWLVTVFLFPWDWWPSLLTRRPTTSLSS